MSTAPETESSAAAEGSTSQIEPRGDRKRGEAGRSGSPRDKSGSGSPRDKPGTRSV
jgi:hypothetical protein